MSGGNSISCSKGYCEIQLSEAPRDIMPCSSSKTTPTLPDEIPEEEPPAYLRSCSGLRLWDGQHSVVSTQYRSCFRVPKGNCVLLCCGEERPFNSSADVCLVRPPERCRQHATYVWVRARMKVRVRARLASRLARPNRHS